MFVSFKEVMQYVSYYQLKEDFSNRIEGIIDQSESQNWPNTDLFEEVANDFVD